MAVFLAIIFGILALHICGGTFHRRCRLTPAPLVFTPTLESCEGWCFTATSSNLPHQVDDPAQVYAAWCTEPCRQALGRGEPYVVWPLDHSQMRLCGGHYKCQPPTVPPEDPTFVTLIEQLGVPLEFGVPRETYCGNALSDDKAFGPHGTHVPASGKIQTGASVSDYMEELNYSELNFGLTRFDHLPGAALVVFQSITLEGWVEIM